MTNSLPMEGLAAAEVPRHTYISVPMLSKKLGMQRIVLKSNKFVGFFIEDPQSSFYESDVFGTLLSKVQHSNNFCRLAQKGDKLRLIIDSARNINEVYLNLQKLSY